MCFMDTMPRRWMDGVNQHLATVLTSHTLKHMLKLNTILTHGTHMLPG